MRCSQHCPCISHCPLLYCQSVCRKHWCSFSQPGTKAVILLVSRLLQIRGRILFCMTWQTPYCDSCVSAVAQSVLGDCEHGHGSTRLYMWRRSKADTGADFAPPKGAGLTARPNALCSHDGSCCMANSITGSPEVHNTVMADPRLQFQYLIG